MQAIEYLKKASKDQAVGTILITFVIMSMFAIAGPAMEKMAGRPHVSGSQFIWQLVSSSTPAMLLILLIILNILVDLFVLLNINHAKYNLWLFIPNSCVVCYFFIKIYHDFFLFFNICLLFLFFYKLYKYYQYYVNYQRYIDTKKIIAE